MILKKSPTEQQLNDVAEAQTASNESAERKRRQTRNDEWIIGLFMKS